MASSFLDNCGFNPTLGGTTDWTYSSVLAGGYQSPTAAGAVTATLYSYYAKDPSGSPWEMGSGLCTITGGVPTFARTTVLYNSSGTGTGVGQSGAGTKISFATAPQVAIVALAEDIRPVTFTYVGDSLSDVTGVGTWPLNIAANFAFFNRGKTYNYAVSGQTAATMAGLYATQPGAVTLGSEAYLFVWAGRNDVNVSTAAATIYGYLTSEWAAGRASGYKVVAFTVMVGQDTAPMNAIRVALNAMIRAGSANYDYLVDVDLYFADGLDTVLRTSTSHLTPVGNAMLAQRVAATILGTNPVPAAPTDAYSTNMAMNSAQEIDQRNAGAAVAGLTGSSTTIITDGYTVLTGGTSVVTAQQVSDAPWGMSKSLKLTVTTAEASLASTSFVTIRTAVEGFNVLRLAGGSIYSRPITVGFWTKINRAITYSAAVGDQSGRKYPFSFTQNTSNVWEFKTVIVPGDIAGAWTAAGNAAGLYLWINMAAGTSFQSTANTWGSSVAVTGTGNGVAATSDVFQITGVVILPMAQLLLPERMPMLLRNVNEELPRCQRQFCSDFPLGTKPADNVQDHRYMAISYLANFMLSQRIAFPARMLSVPTVTPFSSTNAPHGAGKWQYFNAAGAFADATSMTATTADTDGFCYIAAGTVSNSGGWVLAGSWKAEAGI